MIAVAHKIETPEFIYFYQRKKKKEDDDHPYGHERFEYVTAIVLSVVLLITGLFIARGAVTKITGGDSNDLETPGVLALVAAVSSIVTKEAMYRYTNHYAARYDSAATTDRKSVV